MCRVEPHDIVAGPNPLSLFPSQQAMPAVLTASTTRMAEPKENHPIEAALAVRLTVASAATASGSLVLPKPGVLSIAIGATTTKFTTATMTSAVQAAFASELKSLAGAQAFKPHPRLPQSFMCCAACISSAGAKHLHVHVQLVPTAKVPISKPLVTSRAHAITIPRPRGRPLQTLKGASGISVAEAYAEDSGAALAAVLTFSSTQAAQAAQATLFSQADNLPVSAEFAPAHLEMLTNVMLTSPTGGAADPQPGTATALFFTARLLAGSHLQHCSVFF